MTCTDINDATYECHAFGVVIVVTVTVIVLEQADDNLS